VRFDSATLVVAIALPVSLGIVARSSIDIESTPTAPPTPASNGGAPNTAYIATCVAGAASIAFGTTPGMPARQTARVTLARDVPLELSIDGLPPNTRYFYRLNFQVDIPGWGPTIEYAFHTARAPGQTFVFGLEGGDQLGGDPAVRDGGLLVRNMPEREELFETLKDRSICQ